MEKKAKKDKETKIDKGIRRYIPLIIGLAVLAMVFIGLYYAFSGMGKVNYEDLVFIKQKFGSLQVYTYKYNVLLESGKVVQNELYLRTNPRENNVTIDGEIVFPPRKTVFVSVNSTGLNECEDGSIALGTLASFLGANSLVAKGGTPDENESRQKNLTYATCRKYPENTVILVRAANQTGIKRTDVLCYEVRVANCEIMPAIEKFIVQSILDSRKQD